MHFTFHTPFTLPIALAAMHGTTDLAKPLHRLLPYGAFVWWPEAIPVTPVFVCASVIHFARDVGGVVSFIMHCLFVVGAALDLEDDVFNLFALYFCFVHTPMHYARHFDTWRYPLVATLLCGIGFVVYQQFQTVFQSVFHLPPYQPYEFVLTEWMQRLVIAHIACDELPCLQLPFWSHTPNSTD